MEKFIKKLKKELENVDNNYDYYDSSESTRRLKQAETRQIERMIDMSKAINTKLNRMQKELDEKAEKTVIYGGAGRGVFN